MEGMTVATPEVTRATKYERMDGFEDVHRALKPDV
jgi:hypothetical protein